MQTSPAPVSLYINDAVKFFKGNAQGLALIVLPYAILNELALLFYIKGQTINQQLLSILALELLLFPILRTVVILYSAAKIGGYPRSVIACYSHSVQFWPQMLLLTLFVLIASTTGFFLFIIPGIFILVRLALSEMFLILGKQGLFRSINLSIAATGAPWGWVLFKGLALLFPLITALTVVLSQLLAAFDNAIVSFLITWLLSMLRCLYIIFLYRIYSASQRAQ